MGACANKAAIAIVQQSRQTCTPDVRPSNVRVKDGIKATLLDMKKVNTVPCLSLESSPLYRRRIEGGKSLPQTPALYDTSADI